MREDIYGGLKNAMERGATLDQAIASFINSGYAADEVREAARALNAGAMYSTNPQSQSQRPSSQMSPQTPQQPTSFRPMPTRTQVQPARVQPQPTQPMQFSQNRSTMPQTPQQPRPQTQPMSFQRPAVTSSDNSSFAQRLNQMRQNMQQSKPSNMQSPSQPQTPQQPQMQQQMYSQNATQEAPTKKVDTLLVILVIVLIVSIGFFVASLLYKQQIADFLKSFLA